jgi:hypothetical protein
MDNVAILPEIACLEGEINENRRWFHQVRRSFPSPHRRTQCASLPLPSLVASARSFIAHILTSFLPPIPPPRRTHSSRTSPSYPLTSSFPHFLASPHFLSTPLTLRTLTRRAPYSVSSPHFLSPLSPPFTTPPPAPRAELSRGQDGGENCRNSSQLRHHRDLRKSRPHGRGRADPRR